MNPPRTIKHSRRPKRKDFWRPVTNFCNKTGSSTPVWFPQRDFGPGITSGFRVIRAELVKTLMLPSSSRIDGTTVAIILA
jgi:hypothetical protein